MTTFADLIERTKRHLYTETRDEVDKLAAQIATTSATSLTTTYQRGGIQVGAILACELEEMYVLAVSGATVTVARGWNGTTAATHANGTLLFVNPRVSAGAIAKAINEDLVDLSAQGLFGDPTVSFTYTGGTDTYDLTGVTDLTRVLTVKYDANDGTGRWFNVGSWSVDRDADTSLYPSGMSITLSWAEPGRPVRVTYARPFAALSALTDDVATVGLVPASMHDIPPLGAALNLTVGAEVARNWLTLGNNRRADDVPAGARLGEFRGLAAKREQRINSERARLYAKYPERSPR